MECPVCYESRSFNEFKYPACKHPVCHECVVGLHGSSGGVAHPRCPACRQELEDPTEVLERQLMDVRRELAEVKGEASVYRTHMLLLRSDLKRAYVTEAHMTRALMSQNMALFEEACDRRRLALDAEGLAYKDTVFATDLNKRVFETYARFDWKCVRPLAPPAPREAEPEVTTQARAGGVAGGLRERLELRAKELRAERRRALDPYPHPWTTKRRSRAGSSVE